jgi:tetratricopeptide (TPR) repeat protein
LIRDGLAATSNANGDYIGTYDGGALGRYIAGIYSNPGARPVGLYKPQDALTLVTAAYAAAPNADRAFPEALRGTDYYENVWVLGDVLRELGRKDDAIAKLQAAITELEGRIEDEDLPAGRGYEAQFQLGKLKSLLEKIQTGN